MTSPRPPADGVNTANYQVNTIISNGVILGSDNPNSSAASAQNTGAVSSGASSAQTTGMSMSGSMSGSMSASGSMATVTTSARASGANAAASSSTSGAAGAAIRSSSVDGNILAIAGLTFAGVVGGMVLML